MTFLGTANGSIVEKDEEMARCDREAFLYAVGVDQRTKKDRYMVQIKKRQEVV